MSLGVLKRCRIEQNIKTALHQQEEQVFELTTKSIELDKAETQRAFGAQIVNKYWLNQTGNLP